MSRIRFVIVGAILAAALIGSVYFLKQHGEAVRKDQAIATYDKQQAKQQKSNESNKGVVTTKDTTTSNTSDSTDSTQELPVTGPKYIISEAVEAGLLTVVLAAYIVSRRKIVRYL
jgi:type II secretory pathway pseudopilin PulG